MSLKFSGFALLGFGLVLSASGGCRAQVKTSTPTVHRQSLPCATAKAQLCPIVLPIDRGKVFGVILVEVQINGKPGVLILDTGASTTILSPEASGLNPIDLRRADPPKKGTGFVEVANWGEATLVTGARIWKDHRILVADMKSISDANRQKIDGILGQDILDEFKHIEIDLEGKQLVLNSD
jgi:hypothetical protein